MKMGSAGWALCAAFVLGAWTAPTWAAREFTPQAGLWMIPSENNGQPGRGFSLDVQGNTAFLQVFNYEKSGAATFHTAVGQLDDAASMTVPLLRFKGGRFFGGPPQDAVEDGSAGNVTVKFTDGLNGQIQFPGEASQAISRLIVNEKLPFWWATPPNDPKVLTGGQRSMKWTTTANDGARFTWRSTLAADREGRLTLSLTPYASASLYPRNYSYQCQVDSATQVVDCLGTLSDPGALVVPGALEIQRVRFRAFGPDVVGVIQPVSPAADRLTLNGWVDGSGTAKCVEPCLYANDLSSRAYTPEAFMNDDCIPEMCNFTTTLMVLPTSGAWMFSDEKNGQPGRGVFLDVQDSTIIMETSDYLAHGEPTFHMGAGTLAAIRLESASEGDRDTTARLELKRSAGGRYFGGPAQSGAETENAGQLQLGIAPWDDRGTTDFGTAQLQLPGEKSKQIRRLQLEATDNPMSNKLGEYLVRWSLGARLSWIRLTRLEDNIAKTSDGLTQCYGATVLSPRTMRCALLPTPDLFQDWLTHADVELNPFHRNMQSSNLIMRTRDHHGNWLGLGPVRLPGLDIPAN